MAKNRYFFADRSDSRVFELDRRGLAALRIALGLLTAVDIVLRCQFLGEHYSDQGVLPRTTLLATGWVENRLSLHLASGGAAFQGVLAALTVLAALAAAAGWRTRLTTALTWFLVLSLQTRNPLVNQGGDVLIRSLWFWLMLLPAGAVWSVDAWRSGRAPSAEPAVRGPAAAGMILQVAALYVFAGLLKLEDVSWVDGSAILAAFANEQYARPIGLLLAPLADLRPFVAHATVVTEIMAPLLLLFPAGMTACRMAAVLAIAGLHAGIGLTLDVGIFNFAPFVMLLGLLPRPVWDRVEPRVAAVAARLLPRAEPRAPVAPMAVGASQWAARAAAGARRGGDLLLHGAAAASVGLMLAFNAATLKNSDLRLPPFVRSASLLLGLDQHWAMFRSPLMQDGWLVHVGRLTDGRLVDPARPGSLPTLERPESIAASFGGDRWRKYMTNTVLGSHQEWRLAYGRFLCASWMRQVGSGPQLAGIQVLMMARRVDEASPDFEPRVMATFDCTGTALQRFAHWYEKPVEDGRLVF